MRWARSSLTLVLVCPAAAEAVVAELLRQAGSDSAEGETGDAGSRQRSGCACAPLALCSLSCANPPTSRCCGRLEANACEERDSVVPAQLDICDLSARSTLTLARCHRSHRLSGKPHSRQRQRAPRGRMHGYQTRRVGYYSHWRGRPTPRPPRGAARVRKYRQQAGMGLGAVGE